LLRSGGCSPNPPDTTHKEALMSTRKTAKPPLSKARDNLAEAAHNIGTAVSSKVEELKGAASASLSKARKDIVRKGNETRSTLKSTLHDAEVKLKKAATQARKSVKSLVGRAEKQIQATRKNAERKIADVEKTTDQKLTRARRTIETKATRVEKSATGQVASSKPASASAKATHVHGAEGLAQHSTPTSAALTGSSTVNTPARRRHLAQPCIHSHTVTMLAASA
jgi:phage-related protein